MLGHRPNAIRNRACLLQQVGPDWALIGCSHISSLSTSQQGNTSLYVCRSTRGLADAVSFSACLQLCTHGLAARSPSRIRHMTRTRPGSLIVWPTPGLAFAPVLLAKMDPRDEYRDNLSSPGSYANRQWSPPPRFREHDQIYSAQVSPQTTYSAHTHSPPQVSPPLREYREEYVYPNHDEVPHAIYDEG